VSAGERPVVALSRALPPLFTDALEQLAEVRVTGVEAPDVAFAGASVYLATGIDPVPAELIDRFPDTLGLIANIATGTDNIDIAAASARGIAVSNTPVVAEDTADLTFALILAACRRLSSCERQLRTGNWDAGATQMGVRVHGKTLGIVGLGAIGQAVARRAAGFGMTLLYHGPRPKPEAAQTLGARYCEDLGELLAGADVVSLNCPLTADNRHLMNADTLAQMKPGAILVNTGRGPLVDEQALVDALQSGHLGGAGLDVFEFEPQVNAGLLELDNVTLLPHIGSATPDCRRDMALRAIDNIRQFLDQGQPLDLCNTV
jgi:glyoxylate reductase